MCTSLAFYSDTQVTGVKAAAVRLWTPHGNVLVVDSQILQMPGEATTELRTPVHLNAFYCYWQPLPDLLNEIESLTGCCCARKS